MRKIVMLTLGLFAAATAMASTVQHKPNVIFIKTDDQRFDSLSMTGFLWGRTASLGSDR